VAVSSDGRRIVTSLTAANNDLWVLEEQSSALTRLTFTGENNNPVWSPDGRRILFGADQGSGQVNVYGLSADASGTAERLVTSPNFQAPSSVSSDGRHVLIDEFDPTSGRQDIVVLTLGDDTGATPKPFASTPFEEYSGAFSPDGRWVAYVSNESGRFEVYVQAFPAGAGKRQISVEGGTFPVWSRDGRELYFWAGDAVMAATFSPGPPGSASKPQKLFQGPYAFAPLRVAADGRFLLIRKSEEETSSRQINIVLGFDELLKRRLAASQ
jgi:Tol biopolymer transport system component